MQAKWDILQEAGWWAQVPMATDCLQQCYGTQTPLAALSLPQGHVWLSRLVALMGKQP